MELIEGLTLRDYLSLREAPSRSASSEDSDEWPPAREDERDEGSASSGALKFDLSAFAEESPSEEGAAPLSTSRDSARMSPAEEPWSDSDSGSDDLDPLGFEAPDDGGPGRPFSRGAVLRLEELVLGRLATRLSCEVRWPSSPHQPVRIG